MKKLNFIKIIAFMLIAVILTLTGCRPKQNPPGFNVTLVTDVGGIHDGSFNQSAWAGLNKLKEETGANINYTESKQATYYAPNIDRSVENNYDLIWVTGFAAAKDLERLAKLNPSQNFAIVDVAYKKTPQNVCCVTFSSEQSAFMVGYAAALTTKTDKIGFIGGVSSNIIDQFDNGFQAGVAYGAKELKKQINISVQYAESFSDAAKAKQIATKMYSSECDIIFHAAGQSGNGLFAAAKETGNLAIGVDSDQLKDAPENCLTSALKRVDVAVKGLSQKAMNGENIYGENFEFGAKEDCVGIPEYNPNMSPEVYQKTMEIKEKLSKDEIKAPKNKEGLEKFLQELK